MAKLNYVGTRSFFAIQQFARPSNNGQQTKKGKNRICFNFMHVIPVYKCVNIHVYSPKYTVLIKVEAANSFYISYIYISEVSVDF